MLKPRTNSLTLFTLHTSETPLKIACNELFSHPRMPKLTHTILKLSMRLQEIPTRTMQLTLSKRRRKLVSTTLILYSITLPVKPHPACRLTLFN